MSDVGHEETVKKKPGRPRKNANETSPKAQMTSGEVEGDKEIVKKGPGRPRKQAIKDVGDAEVLPKDPPGEVDAVKETTKKSPGRPRKHAVKEDGETKGLPPKAEAPGEVVKKKRGRPRMAEKASSVAGASKDGPPKAEGASTSGEAAAKKKRGRPPNPAKEAGRPRKLGKGSQSGPSGQGGPSAAFDRAAPELKQPSLDGNSLLYDDIAKVCSDGASHALQHMGTQYEILYNKFRGTVQDEVGGSVPLSEILDNFGKDVRETIFQPKSLPDAILSYSKHLAEQIEEGVMRKATEAYPEEKNSMQVQGFLAQTELLGVYKFNLQQKDEALSQLQLELSSANKLLAKKEAE